MLQLLNRDTKSDARTPNITLRQVRTSCSQVSALLTGIGTGRLAPFFFLMPEN